jgi:hypothetical protein
VVECRRSSVGMAADVDGPPCFSSIVSGNKGLCVIVLLGVNVMVGSLGGDSALLWVYKSKE